MSKSITALVPREAYTDEDIETIRRTIAMGSSDAELKLFVKTCQRLELDPFSRQVYFIKRKQRVNGNYVEVGRAEVSIDGFRASAEMTGEYEGQTPYYWCGKDAAWTEVWLDSAPPSAAKVGVFRKGFRDPIWSVARYGAYVQVTRDGNPNSMWRKMPDNQLAKCAEALALRRAFPRRFGGVYTTDEMAQAHNEPPGYVDAEVVEQAAAAPVPEIDWDGLKARILATDTQEAFDAMLPELKALPEGENRRRLSRLAGAHVSALRNRKENGAA